MFRSLLRTLFGCSHQHSTFPLTLERRMYVVCLDCGQELSYDWVGMKVGAPLTSVVRQVQVQEVQEVQEAVE